MSLATSGERLSQSFSIKVRFWIIQHKGSVLEEYDSALKDAYKDAKDFTLPSCDPLNIPKP
jgi:hypothetical protein